VVAAVVVGGGVERERERERKMIREKDEMREKRKGRREKRKEKRRRKENQIRNLESGPGCGDVLAPGGSYELTP
jgi:hypothetical protein